MKDHNGKRWHIIQDRTTRELFLSTDVGLVGDTYPVPQYGVIARYSAHFATTYWVKLPWGRGFGAPGVDGSLYSTTVLGEPNVVKDT